MLPLLISWQTKSDLTAPTHQPWSILTQGVQYLHGTKIQIACNVHAALCAFSQSDRNWPVCIHFRKTLRLSLSQSLLMLRNSITWCILCQSKRILAMLKHAKETSCTHSSVGIGWYGWHLQLTIAAVSALKGGSGGRGCSSDSMVFIPDMWAFSQMKCTDGNVFHPRLCKDSWIGQAPSIAWLPKCDRVGFRTYDNVTSSSRRMIIRCHDIPLWYLYRVCTITCMQHHW